MRLNWFCFAPALLAAATLQVSCTRFKLNTAEMTPDEIVQRSTHLLIGVIEKHEFPTSLLFRPGAEDPPGWRVIRMRIRVELVIRGQEPNPTVDIYEVFPTVGVSGDWNSTQDGGRYLFPVRKEHGHYRVTRDFWRSIYPYTAGATTGYRLMSPGHFGNGSP